MKDMWTQFRKMPVWGQVVVGSLTGLVLLGVIGAALGGASSDKSKKSDTTASKPTTSTTTENKPQPKPAPTVVPKPKPTPTAAARTAAAQRRRLEAELKRSMRRFFRYYNSGNYIKMSAYLDDKLADKCGGSTNWGFAYFQNHRMEKIDYSLRGLKATAVRDDGETVDADVNVMETDKVNVQESGAQELGFTFIKDPVLGWVQDKDFPPGVGAFCHK